MDYTDFNPIDFTSGLNSSENMQTSWSPGQYDFSPYGIDFRYNSGTVGSDNDNPGFDQAGMEAWLNNNNYSLREMNDTGSNMTYRGLFGANGQPVTPTQAAPSYAPNFGAIQSFENNDPVFRMAALAAAGMVNPAFLGTQLGATGLGAQALGGGVLGANASLFSGAKTLKDVGTSALAGAGGAGLASFNPAGMLGVTNNVGAGALNGAVRGALGSGIGGGNIGAGALSGGLVGGFNGLSATGLDDLPGTMGGNIDMAEGIGGGDMSYGQNEANIQAASLSPTAFSNTPLESSYRSYAQGAGSGEGGSSSSSPNVLSDIFANGIPSFGGGRVGLGDFAGGLLGLYQAYDQRKRSKDLAGQLSSNYGPNSAYAGALRQNLLRQDAKAGRRSQVGSREAEFQAKMADVNARMAPTLSNLNQQVSNSNITMANSMLNLGKLFGGNAFNMPSNSGPTKPSSFGLPSFSLQMPTTNHSLGNPNGTINGIRPEWLNTIGNGG